MRDHDDAAGVCRVGEHPHNDVGALCTYHLEAARAHLATLPRLVRSLTHYLVPGPSLPGEKVATTRVGSPTPARLDVLTLVGPGATEIRRDRRALVPQVRRWSTVETVTVATPRGPGRPPELERREVRVWHRELVVDNAGRPLLVADDDQVGVVPPAEWADVWVRRWRRELGVAVPPRGRAGGWIRRWRKPGDPKAGTRGRSGAPVAMPAPEADRVARERAAQVAQVAEDQAARLADATVREALLMRHGRPLVLPAVAAYVALKTTYAAQLAAAQAHVRNTLLGLDTSKPAGGASSDAVAAEWVLRYGGATTAAHVEVDAGHLAQWLPYAAERDDAGVGEFVVELRALVAELEHALGETRDDHWVGRCPAELHDGDGDPTGRLCGYGLWQDPYRSRIECPRCHTVWREKEWLALAARIRAAWPIDRRRLYTLGDRVAAEKHTERLPECRGCERTMAVEWREVRGRGYRETMYRPVGWACPVGCIAGGTQVAA